MKGILRLDQAQWVITAHKRQRVKTEQRQISCLPRRVGLPRSPAGQSQELALWLLENTPALITEARCSFLTLPQQKLYLLLLYVKLPNMYGNLFQKCFSFSPIDQMFVPFSKLWEQKRNTSVPAETGTREPSVERKRKCPVSKLFPIH